MDFETAKVFAEAFSGASEGAAWAFVAWVAFDFAKEVLPYAFWAAVFMVLRKPAGKILKALLTE